MHKEIKTQQYADYDALWHLICLGVLNDKHEVLVPTLAQPEGRKTRVAMIDTSVAIDHPNLSEAINRELALDLFSARLGSFPYIEQCTSLPHVELNTRTNVCEGLPLSGALQVELIDRLSHSSSLFDRDIRPTVSPAFSNHGTCVAGLVGARATAIGAQDTASGPHALPYRGVDDSCEIVPISTNFDPDPESLIIAFLYAELIDASVILLPRTIPDPKRQTPELSTTFGDTPLTQHIRQTAPNSTRETLWQELAQLMVNVSLNRPIVCAHGNANEQEGIYPANLADVNNGIISVGSVNAKGYRSGYSVLHGPTVVAPSDDAEVFNREEIRLDEQAHNYDERGVPKDNNNALYSHFDIIATDVPGAAGYSGSVFKTDPEDLGVRDVGSYYTRFGGTSAASSLVAGMISLGISSGAIDDTEDGISKKSWLIAQCRPLNNEHRLACFASFISDVKFPDG